VKASAGVEIRSVAFSSAQSGILLDTTGRLFSTRNGGRSWSELRGAGTSGGVQLAFTSPADGFMSTSGHLDGDDTYVLRTTNGGATWHPQEISVGSIPYDGLLASSALDAAAILDGASATGEALNRAFFSTSTGGDVSGASGALALSTSRKTFTTRRLKAARYSVRINGTLAGAIGGERIVVSRRALTGGSWQHQVVVAGANGGSFATTWHVTASSVFVAQWAGDSGRPGQGSKVLTVTVD
jgi:hypothetical protein